MKKIGIVGAGISGLICAYRLIQKGAQVVVFEKNVLSGGRIPYCGAIATEKFYPKTVALVRELNLESLKIPVLLEEQGFYSEDEKLINGKKMMSLFLKELGALGTVSFIKLSNFVNKLNFDPKNPDEKLAEFRDISFTDYLSTHPEKVRNFLINFSSIFIFENDFKKVNAEYGLCQLRMGNEFATNKAFGFEDNNLMTLTNVLHKKINDLGGKILTSAEVSSVEKNKDNFKVNYLKIGEMEEKEELVDSVVFATTLDAIQEIFPQLNFDSCGIFYGKTKCLFVEGENRWPKLKFIIGLRGNPANLRAIFNLSNVNMVYPLDETKDVDLEKFYIKHKIIQEKKIYPALPIYMPGVKFPEVKTRIPGAYICGDFFHYPTLEASIVSGEEAANLCMREQ